jgi:hypothetical protein
MLRFLIVGVAVACASFAQARENNGARHAHIYSHPKTQGRATACVAILRGEGSFSITGCVFNAGVATGVILMD